MSVGDLVGKALLRPALMACALGALAACTWVKLSDGGALVRQAQAGDVSDCRHLGKVTTHTRDKVVMERNNAKVQEELIVLARNEAASFGADTIVPAGPVIDGRQDFDAYNCGADNPG